MKLIATTEKVQIKWFVWFDGNKYTKKTGMVGYQGYDAKCSCGWESRTGGAFKSCVETDVQVHKMMEHNYTFELELSEIVGA
jgi:hypothetical protein